MRLSLNKARQGDMDVLWTSYTKCEVSGSRKFIDECHRICLERILYTARSRVIWSI